MKLRVLLFVFALVLFNSKIKSGDGTLDFSVTEPIGQTFTNWIQTDSKIIAGGSTSSGSLLLARFNPDGTLDKASFGSPNGFVNQIPNAQAITIIVQPDLNNPKILAAGENNVNNQLLVARYQTNGDLDPTFGGSGEVITPQGVVADGIAIQTDRKIVISGLDASGNNFFIARYDLDGNLDSSFNSSGFVIGPPGEAQAIAIQADGKIVVAGLNGASPGVIIARYTTTGQLDQTFGVNGIATFTNADIIQSVAIQPDGKIVISGETTQNFFVARFLSNGNLDTLTFNFPNGFIAIPPSDANSVLLQPDGKIIAVGSVFSPTNFRVARYLSTGQLDSLNFSPPNGFVTGPAIDFGVGGALLQNGKIAAIGGTFPANVVLAVYNNNNPLINTTITSPTNGSTLTPGSVTFMGTAQNLSFVYLYLDGNFLAGFPTDTSGSNTWSFTTNVSSGTHTAQVVSIYNAGHVNLQSDPVTFDVAPGTTTLFATKSTNLLTLNALAGNVFSYNITVRNTGTTAATGVILTDSLPDGLTYLSSSISNGGSTSFLNNVITANIGTIAAGGFVTVTINVAINQCFSGSLTNISSITSSNAPSISAVNNINALIPSNLIRSIFSKYC